MKIFTKDTKGKMTEPVLEIKSVEALYETRNQASYKRPFVNSVQNFVSFVKIFVFFVVKG